MWSLVKEKLLAPLARRVGTMGGGALISYGYQQDLSAHIETVAAGVLFVLADLLASNWNTGKVKAKAKTELLRSQWAGAK